MYYSHHFPPLFHQLVSAQSHFLTLPCHTHVILHTVHPCFLRPSSFSFPSTVILNTFRMYVLQYWYILLGKQYNRVLLFLPKVGYLGI